MIIPVRCFTCNKVLGNLYKSYLIQMKELNLDESNDIISNIDEILEKGDEDKIKQVFVNLGVNRYCCKRHLLSHVDLIQKI